jgi:hypothetical protein
VAHDEIPIYLMVKAGLLAPADQLDASMDRLVAAG